MEQFDLFNKREQGPKQEVPGIIQKYMDGERLQDMGISGRAEMTKAVRALDYDIDGFDRDEVVRKLGEIAREEDEEERSPYGSNSRFG